MEFFDITRGPAGVNPISPASISWYHHYEQNIQGMSYHLGFLVQTKFNLNVQYKPAIRYDHAYDKIEGKNLIQKKDLILDHHIDILKTLPNKKSSIGLGLSIINHNKQFNDFFNNTHNLEFLTYNAVYQRHFFKNLLSAEIKVLYIPKGQLPVEKKQDFLSYSIGLQYNILKK